MPELKLHQALCSPTARIKPLPLVTQITSQTPGKGGKEADRVRVPLAEGAQLNWLCCLWLSL